MKSASLLCEGSLVVRVLEENVYHVIWRAVILLDCFIFRSEYPQVDQGWSHYPQACQGALPRSSPQECPGPSQGSSHGPWQAQGNSQRSYAHQDPVDPSHACPEEPAAQIQGGQEDRQASVSRTHACLLLLLYHIPENPECVPEIQIR